ncbi:MAG: hypothetical protein A2315_01940 [Ignavibacteria bacterium RIFOXYB2_FULL_35_12]|nr:MAG: hypothetical protein A2058_01235 [Ignavibacteria bacterium GWA2_36_19]OGU49461.1 MAG: hypothetical protein A2006_11105 [Ignavibacteria bacterium GWC2_35_8]OGU62099.1 MAG: hypothetical protein A2X60_00350 [Ignavibacteria bacterium GWF2_35_20]OGU79760.1 MAG: hypothetical protein A2254_02445 [Ignavibacteria bacterium RIFOXYA2_FULL_35_9]OGU80772.1 MAG: hypothetical protein A2W11_07545 [Ignavibacteria bacterium RBG_16_35_7]OGU84075.1 MAG: hypothetical protein A3K31_10840 [Ignavibacteria bac
MRITFLIVVVLSVLSPSLLSQEIIIPQNPLNGRLVFEEKGCIECHSIGGFGGTTGPSLTRDLYFGSVLELATIIWNHTPQMNRKFRQMTINRPQLTENEMLDLFGFLYYLRYLGEPGSVAKGKKLLEIKGCSGCHSIGASGGSIGPSFENIQQYASPLYIVQTMWNHGPAMQEQLKKSGVKYPILTGQDIADITMYIRQATMGNDEIRMAPGNPNKGKEVFDNKGCDNCHLTEGKAKRILAPNLRKLELKKSVTETASSMWNHGPMMLKEMKKESIDWPIFVNNEMADLIAYLYFLGFEDKSGDKNRGERTFKDKSCNSCHKTGREGKGPDLTKIKKFDSPIKMVQLMWNHASEMEDLLISQNKPWPTLDTGDMCDLYAYLKYITQK